MSLFRYSLVLATVALLSAYAAAQPLPGTHSPPGQRPIVGIPEVRLTVAPLAFTAPLAGSIAFPAEKPGGQLTVQTRGGILPITISVEAGAHGALFAIATPTSNEFTVGGTSAISPVQSGPASTIKDVLKGPIPAGPIERVLKFTGGTSANLVPAQIPITLVAIDGKGSRATLALTVYPVAPRLASVDTPIDPYRTIAVPLSFLGLGGAATVELKSLAGCSISLNPNIRYPVQHNVNSGAASTSRTAILQATGTTCTVTATIALRLPGRKTSEAPITVSAPVKLAARHSYRVTGTWALRDQFNFRLHQTNANIGTCAGDSIGPIPPFPNFPVGVREHSGDISMAIRSGPFSTTCFYLSDQWVLPDGVTLKAFKATQTIDPPATIGSKVTCSAFDISDTGDLAKHTVRGLKKIYPDNEPSDGGGAGFTVSGWGPLATSDGVILLQNNNRFTTILLPTFARLKCFKTLTNDHGMRLVIDEFEFLGPPGLTFP